MGRGEREVRIKKGKLKEEERKERIIGTKGGEKRGVRRSIGKFVSTFALEVGALS
jgi:hypothetical protein